MASDKIQWYIDLQPLVGKRVNIETLEGHNRTAKLEGVEFYKTEIDGYEVGVPNALKLEDDQAIPLQQIKYVRRAE